MEKEKITFKKIRDLVSHIPEGRVVTYGDIADFLGTKDARKIGWALTGNRDPKIPCHRVIKKDGCLAKKFSLGGWQEQRARLEVDGITFLKERQVDLEKHRWRISL